MTNIQPNMILTGEAEIVMQDPSNSNKQEGREKGVKLFHDIYISNRTLAQRARRERERIGSERERIGSERERIESERVRIESERKRIESEVTPRILAQRLRRERERLNWFESKDAQSTAFLGLPPRPSQLAQRLRRERERLEKLSVSAEPNISTEILTDISCQPAQCEGEKETVTTVSVSPSSNVTPLQQTSTQTDQSGAAGTAAIFTDSMLNSHKPSSLPELLSTVEKVEEKKIEDSKLAPSVSASSSVELQERERLKSLSVSTEPTISTETTFFPGLSPSPCQPAQFEREKGALPTVSVSPSSNITSQQTDLSGAGTTAFLTDSVFNSHKPSRLPELFSTVESKDAISKQSTSFPGLPPRRSQLAQRLRQKRARLERLSVSKEPTISTGLSPSPCQHAQFEREKEALPTVLVSPSSNVTRQETSTQTDQSGAGTTALLTDSMLNSHKPISLPEMLSTVEKVEEKKIEDSMLARSVSALSSVELQETAPQFDQAIVGKTPLQTDSLLNSSKASSVPDLHSVGGSKEAMRDTTPFPQESIQANKEPLQTISFNEGTFGLLTNRQMAQRLRRKRERVEDVSLDVPDTTDSTIFGPPTHRQLAQRLRRQKQRVEEDLKLTESTIGLLTKSQMAQRLRRKRERVEDVPKSTESTIFGPLTHQQMAQRLRLKKEGAEDVLKSTEATTSTQNPLFQGLPPRPCQLAPKQPLSQLVSSTQNPLFQGLPPRPHQLAPKQPLSQLVSSTQNPLIQVLPPRLRQLAPKLPLPQSVSSTQNTLFQGLPPRPRPLDPKQSLSQSVSSSSDITHKKIDHSNAGTTPLQTGSLPYSSKSSSLLDLHSVGGSTELMKNDKSSHVIKSTESTTSTQNTLFQGLPPRPHQHAPFEQEKQPLSQSVSSSSNIAHTNAVTTLLQTGSLSNSLKSSNLVDLHSVGGRTELMGNNKSSHVLKSTQSTTSTQNTLFQGLPPRSRQHIPFEQEKQPLSQPVSSSLSIPHAKVDHSIAGTTSLQTGSLSNSLKSSNLVDLHSVGGRTELMRNNKSSHVAYQANKESMQTPSCTEWKNRSSVQFERAELFPMVDQMIKTKFRKYRMGKCGKYFDESGRLLSTYESHPLIAIKKTGLRDLQNDNRTVFHNSHGNLLRKEIKSPDVATQISGAKGPTIPRLPPKVDEEKKSSCISNDAAKGLVAKVPTAPLQSTGTNDGKSHLVCSTRKIDEEKNCCISNGAAPVLVAKVPSTALQSTGTNDGSAHLVCSTSKVDEEKNCGISNDATQVLVAVVPTAPLQSIGTNDGKPHLVCSTTKVDEEKNCRISNDAAQVLVAEVPTAPLQSTRTNDGNAHLVCSTRKIDGENNCRISDDAAKVLVAEVPTAHLESSGTNDADPHLVCSTTKADEEEKNCRISDDTAQVLVAEVPTAPLQSTGTNDADAPLVCTTKPDEQVNKCCLSYIPQSEEFREKGTVSQPQAEIREPKSDGVSVILSIPVNSCGTDALREHDQGQLAGVKNPAIPSLEDSQMMEEPISASSMMNSCDSLREHGHGQLAGVNDPAIPFVEDSRMMKDKPISASSMVNSCGNLLFDSPRDNGQRQLAGVNDPAILSVEDSQMMEDQPIAVSSRMNSCGQGQLAEVNNHAIPSVDDSPMEEDQPILVSSTMNSCGNLSPNSFREHAQGQSTGGNNPAVPSVKDSQVIDDQPWKERFIQLKRYLKRCDEKDYVKRLKLLTSDERSIHRIAQEKRAIYLLAEEGRELQRMKVLNIFGNPARNGYLW